MRKRIVSAAVAAVAVGGLMLSGCSASSQSTGSDLVIGATLPLTGSLQAFGTSLQTGYQAAIDEVNADGGLEYGGSKHKVQLVVQDNTSDGDKAGQQAKSLVLDSGAVALLGPATPPLTIPVSTVADQLKVPLISTITPIKGWLSGTETGWTYSWDVFFDETQMTQTQFQASDLTDTNKKVVLFTDTEEDGPIQASLWKDNATKYGYDVVDAIEFPVGNTNFTSQVAEAKASGADIVMAQVTPPDGIALLKEMKAQGYTPKLTFMEKAGNTGGFVDITGGLGQGVLAANWWAEGMGTPREDEFISNYAEVAGGKNSNLATIIYGYSIAEVLLNAFKTADSAEPDAVNTAIGKTDLSTPAGQIKFDTDHAAAMVVVQTQWDGQDQVMVTDTNGKGTSTKIVTPTAGLQ